MRMLLGAAIGCVLVSGMCVAQQEKGNWRAANSSASDITGDVAFGGEKIVINFAPFALAQIRTLKPEEITALFNLDGPPNGTGNLFRVSIPPEKRFAHRNTICGSDETQWVVSYVSGHKLQLAFFSGASMPVLTPEAMANQPSLCGTFSYAR